MDMGQRLVNYMVCLFTPQLLLVLVAPTDGVWRVGQAELAWY